MFVQTLESVFSDLFINLSAGWLGSVFIIYFAGTRVSEKARLRSLTINLPFAILSLVVALVLRLI